MEKTTTLNLTQIRNFNHPVFGEIRTMINGQGETYFVGKDVARALGYRLPQKAVQEHVDREDIMVLTYRAFSKTEKAPLWQGNDHSNKVLIRESGLYALVLSSQLPSARAFKRWVTSEVLPQIRQTGGYIPTRNARTGEALSEAEIVAVADKVMQRTISRGNLPADDCLTTSDIAKMHGMETKALNSLLVDKGVQFWNGSRYKLKAEYAGRGYGQLRKFFYYALDGERKERCYLVWTQKGAEMIRTRIKD